jgi:hypothetical protein
MTSPNGEPNQFNEAMLVVRVDDEINEPLAGQGGCCYESPPQPREQALTLVRLVLGRPGNTDNGAIRWTCPIAGGRRTVTIAVASRREAC